MAYPSSVDSFAANTDGVDDVLAADMNAVQTAIENIETELGTDPAGSVADVKTRLAVSLTDAGSLKLTPGTTLTISSGVITITGNYHKVETEASAASDDLDTINGGVAGLFVRLVTVNDVRDVVIKHGTGNIYCDGGKDITLSNNYEYCDLQYDTTNTRWIASVVSQHTHTESQITDLDHDAVKIDGIAVDLTGIADNETLMYDSGTSTIVKGLEVLHLTVEEADGTPTVANVVKIKVNNGTLTDDGSGVVTIDASGAATDGAAIHENVASEISAITEKTSLAADDMFIIEDSAASNVKKMVKASNIVSGGFYGDVLLRTVVAAGGQANFDIDSIPSGYDVIKIFVQGKSERTDLFSDNVLISLNADTTATNYYNQTIRSVDTGASAIEAEDRIFGTIGSMQDALYIGQIDATIVHPSSPFHKTIFSNSMLRRTAAMQYLESHAIAWENTAAITRITIAPATTEFAEGTLCLIVGYKNH